MLVDSDAARSNESVGVGCRMFGCFWTSHVDLVSKDNLW